MDEPDVADTIIRPRPPLTRKGADATSEGAIDGDTLLRERADARSDQGRLSPPSARPSIHAAAASPKPERPVDPAVYRVSVNGGGPVPLDVRTVVGRAPRMPRVPSRVEPRLIAVNSSDRQVSGTHLELRQEGRSVVVTDLHSTNGTVVTMPGADPIRLRPGDSLVAGPGAVVDLGDGNSIEILPLGHLTAEVQGVLR